MKNSLEAFDNKFEQVEELANLQIEQLKLLSQTQKERVMKKSEQNLRDTWDTIK